MNNWQNNNHNFNKYTIFSYLGDSGSPKSLSTSPRSRVQFTSVTDQLYSLPTKNCLVHLKKFSLKKLEVEFFFSIAIFPSLLMSLENKLSFVNLIYLLSITLTYTNFNVWLLTEKKNSWVRKWRWRPWEPEQLGEALIPSILLAIMLLKCQIYAIYSQMSAQ